MGSELFAACVFCAGTLFNVDLAPPRNFSAELVAGYTTLQRQLEAGVSPGRDRSDVTAKALGVGLRWAKMPEGELGAGTPAFEGRLRFAFSPSHDEASQPQLIATATGRYENFASAFRIGIGAADSFEACVEHRRHKITDLVGAIPLTFAYERDLIAERSDYGVGWRHRWKNLELAAGWTASWIDGEVQTPTVGLLSEGTLMGGRVELKGRRGPWTASLLTQAAGGSLRSTDRFADTTTRQRRSSWVEAVTLSLAGRVQTLDVMLSGTVDRSRLPLVSLAVLGSEQLAFDSGYSPDSRTRQWFLDLVLRHEVLPGVFPRLYFRYTHGSESVLLTDASGVLPPRTLPVVRGGGFPPVSTAVPEFAFGVGLEATVGR